MYGSLELCCMLTWIKPYLQGHQKRKDSELFSKKSFTSTDLICMLLLLKELEDAFCERKR